MGWWAPATLVAAAKFVIQGCPESLLDRYGPDYVRDDYGNAVFPRFLYAVLAEQHAVLSLLTSGTQEECRGRITSKVKDTPSAASKHSYAPEGREVHVSKFSRSHKKKMCPTLAVDSAEAADVHATGQPDTPIEVITDLLQKALQQNSFEGQKQLVQQALDVAGGLDAYLEKVTSPPPQVSICSAE